MASQYKNLFFDLDDTLWAFSLNARDTFEECITSMYYGRFLSLFPAFSILFISIVIQNCGKNTVRGQVSKEELNRQRFLYLWRR